MLDNIHSLKILDLMADILSYRQIVIFGTGYVGRIIGKMIDECIKGGKYVCDVKEVYYVSFKQNKKYLDTLPFPIVENFPDHNKDAILLAADDFEPMSQDMLKLYRSGFDKIIDGVSLANCNYHPLFFYVRKDDERINFDSLHTIAPVLNKHLTLDPIQPELLQRIARDPNDTTTLMAIAKHYSENGKLLLVKDYCSRVLQTKGDHTYARFELDKAKNELERYPISELDMIDSMEKALSINYLGRSGSIYFGSLLEGHQEILSPPAGIVYDPYPELYTLFLAQKGVVDLKDLLKAFSLERSLTNNNHGEWISLKVEGGNGFYPVGYDELYLGTIERLVKQEAIRKEGVLSEKFLLKVMYYAHQVALGRTMDFSKSVPYILNQSHTRDPLAVRKFISMFPMTTVLVTIRDIIQSIGSTLAAFQRENNGKLQRKQVINLLHYYSQNTIITELSKANRTILVPIEKLNLAPDQTMRNIAQKLHIKWDKRLLESTLNGYPLYDGYGGNSTSYSNGPRLTGISKRYDHFFNSFDRFRMEALYYPLLKKWGYDAHDFRVYDSLKEMSLFPYRFEQFIEMNEDEKLSFRKQFSQVYLNNFEKLGSISNLLDRLELV